MKKLQGLKDAKLNAHPEIGGLYVPYILGKATAEEARKVEEHVPECAECLERMGMAMKIAVLGLPAWQPKVPRDKVAPFRR